MPCQRPGDIGGGPLGKNHGLVQIIEITGAVTRMDTKTALGWLGDGNFGFLNHVAHHGADGVRDFGVVRDGQLRTEFARNVRVIRRRRCSHRHQPEVP
ncbi:MAG: hypothetical protein MAG794_00937 [Gammaproteobacteria bacterium]|nr:hypothetical protein [Gammaproteobacteria bacterium]